jgi:hypothetical protein
MNNNTYTLFSEPYLDTYNQCYKNIITINIPPKGPLNRLLRRVKFYPLSPFKQPSACNRYQPCGLSFQSLRGEHCNKDGSHLMVADEIPDLFGFLLANGYKVDTSITKMLNNSDIKINQDKKIICFITYNG